MNKYKKYLMEFRHTPYWWPVLFVILVAFILGIMISGGSRVDSTVHDIHQQGESTAATTAPQTWTCSMHPQIQQPKKGKCPICFMDLIPVETGAAEATGPRQLKLTATAVKLAGIRTAPVEKRFVANEIRMVGKVVVDETRLGHITARVPGRIDRLFVDYTGISVRKGDHLVSLYSPELISAQQELLQALKSFRKFGSGKSFVAAARDKLKLWGLTPEQILRIEKNGKTTDHLTIYSPMAGIVTQKNAVEGAYVKTGSSFYTIADLSRVWIKLDAYESDLSWIRYGQAVEFETEAFPGESFSGSISFIDPVLNPKTRTVKIRVNVSNPDHKLKPEMFVRAVVRSRLSLSGKVMDPDLSGKWISPMHPEVVKDGPGSCDVCGMPLVRAETLGYTAAVEKETEAPLVIPAGAPLITGVRAVVYVAVPDKEGLFEGKEIVLGPKAGDFYVVKQGLHEGEQVVVNGAFKIDSDLQIMAKPSMMSPPVSKPKHDHKTLAKVAASKPVSTDIPNTFKRSIDHVAEGYFKIQHALSSDSLDDAKTGGQFLLDKLNGVDMKLLEGNIHMDWMKLHKSIKFTTENLLKATDIEAARVQFEVMTAPFETIITRFGTRKAAVFKFHCPMAFNNIGAFWLQNNEDTRNPYFGASMLICKDSVEPLFKKKN
jgi:membrane fusion protein, copper/silver efflux system